MPAINSTSGDLDTTGSVTQTRQHTDTLTLAQLSGTYGTVTLVFEGSLDGTNYFPIAAYAYGTNALVTGTVSPTDNAELVYQIPAAGLSSVRARVTAIASGTVSILLQSASYVGFPPIINLSSATFGATTVSGLLTSSAGMLFSGATGVNLLSLTDNLANALDVTESSNSYLRFVTTNSAERVKVGKLLGHSLLATPVAATGAGGGVGGAAAVSLNSVVVISSDGATKGVKLNTGVAGDVVHIINSSGTAANLFAASGGTINGGSADAGCAIAASTGVMAICTAADTWTVYDLPAKASAAA